MGGGSPIFADANYWYVENCWGKIPIGVGILTIKFKFSYNIIQTLRSCGGSIPMFFEAGNRLKWLVLGLNNPKTGFWTTPIFAPKNWPKITTSHIQTIRACGALLLCFLRQGIDCNG